MLDDPNTQLVTKIKRLVAGSITGLDIDNVTLISDRARFGEVIGGGPQGEDEKDFVSVWTMIIGKESLTRFRIIFFSFILITLVLLISLVWVSWKIYPILKRHGGVSSLFHLQALDGGAPAAAPPTEAPKEEAKEAGEDEEEEDDDEDHTDKTKDVT